MVLNAILDLRVRQLVNAEASRHLEVGLARSQVLVAAWCWQACFYFEVGGDPCELIVKFRSSFLVAGDVPTRLLQTAAINLIFCTLFFETDYHLPVPLIIVIIGA